MAGKKGISGRKTDLTDAIAKAIVDDVRGGLAESRSAIKYGFGPSTLTGWKHKGERDLEAGKDSVYAKFAKALTIADVEFEQVRLALILKAGRNEAHWAANLGVLKVKYAHWRPPVAGVEVGGGQSITIHLLPQDVDL